MFLAKAQPLVCAFIFGNAIAISRFVEMLPHPKQGLLPKLQPGLKTTKLMFL